MLLSRTMPQSMIPAPRTLGQSLAGHWPEYLMEAAELGLFMISACVFGVLLEHPGSPVHEAIENPVLRRVLMGLAMGLTAIAIIRSPWGQRSGAHMNPSVTLTFLALKKIEPWDAVLYVVSQFVGGILGVMAAEYAIGFPLRNSAVNYVVTVPGPGGPWVAFAAEVLISGVLMLGVLVMSNNPRRARFTPLLAGTLLAVYITVEAPLSGMSLNPSRTFGSALAAQDWTALWVYFTAPPLGMLAVGLAYRFRQGAHRIFCAKLHHHNGHRCIFRCNYGDM